MNLQTIVWRETRERPLAAAAAALVILLGVLALVAIRHVTVFSERQIAEELATLGANILVLPKSASLENYYSADLHGATLPESDVSLILMGGLVGVEKVSPKLCVPAQIGTDRVTLTGILPQSEFRTKAAWQSIGMLGKKHVGCTKAHLGPDPAEAEPESLVSTRTIEALAPDEILVGADVAQNLALESGDFVEILGEKFRVLAALPSTGTIDDSRVFAHLHEVQRLAGTGEVVNAIEVMGCCEDAAGQLVPELSELLPDSRVVTISQIVQTQVGVNRVMARSSLLVLGVLVLVGGASVASGISSNVRERRHEIGTLMALGATPRVIAMLFLMKAAALGIVGGLGGCVLGVVFAMWIGPQWAGVSVTPLYGLTAMAIAAAVAITVLSAAWPAIQAARLDPCICFREV